jgi:hypothetical protein
MKLDLNLNLVQIQIQIQIRFIAVIPSSTDQHRDLVVASNTEQYSKVKSNQEVKSSGLLIVKAKAWMYESM